MEWSKITGIVAVLGMIVAQVFIYVLAPTESTMGDIQRVFYLHLPLAWWSLISFFVVFVASILYLVHRKSRWDDLAGAAAEIGVLLSGLALITGSLWGKKAWNTWWTWDPRLTTTLIMWFVYAGYLVLRSSMRSGDHRSRICAVLGIVAFLDVPLVFVSARLWRSIHPQVFASQGGMDPEMLTAVLVSVGAFGVFWACLLASAWRLAGLRARVDTLQILSNLTFGERES